MKNYSPTQFSSPDTVKKKLLKEASIIVNTDGIVIQFN